MNTRVEAAWAALEELTDPEIPVITCANSASCAMCARRRTAWRVVITPTYSGCPAMGQIEDDVKATLARAGIAARVVTQLAPAWTTDWMTEAGRKTARLRHRPAAPDAGRQQCRALHQQSRRAPKPCPVRIAARPHGRVLTFGSTACKALYKCLDCQEPFDYFKPY